VRWRRFAILFVPAMAAAAVLVAFLLGCLPLTAVAARKSESNTSALDVLPEQLVARPPGPNWLSYNGDFTGRRYSSLSQITTANVAGLRAQWVFHVSNSDRMEVTPLVVDGVMFITAANDTFALDARTGRQIWRFKRLQLPTGRVLGPIVAIWLLSVGVLVLERDLGTSLLFFGLFVILLYVATGRTGWIAVGLLLACVGAVAVGWLVVLFEVTCSTRASAESDWIGCRFAAMWSCQTCEGAISGGNGSSRQAFKFPRASAIMVWLSISHTLLHDSSFL